MTDVVRLGFEVRVVLTNQTGESSWVQLTHDQAKALNPSIGQRYVVRPRSARGLIEQDPTKRARS